MHKTVWETLLKSQLVEGEMIDNRIESPWYIKLLLSISGWFGALFLLIFIGGSLELIFGQNINDIPLLLTFTGAGLIFFTYNNFKKRQSDFLEHFMLALSVAGQVMVIASFMFMLGHHSDKAVLLFTTVFQAFLMWTIPNYIHRMMSSFFMASAFLSLSYNVGEPFFAIALLTFGVAYLWMHEFNFNNRKKIEAIAYGLTVALFSFKSFAISSPNYFYEMFEYKGAPLFNFWFLESSAILTLVYVLWMILKEQNQVHSNKTFLLMAIATILLALLSFQVGSLILGIILLLIGFAHAHRLLIGLGIFASLAFLSRYYYYFGETLMDKAMVLALMGVVLLVGRFIMNRVLKKEVLDV